MTISVIYSKKNFKIFNQDVQCRPHIWDISLSKSHATFTLFICLIWLFYLSYFIIWKQLIILIYHTKVTSYKLMSTSIKHCDGRLESQWEFCIHMHLAFIYIYFSNDKRNIHGSWRLICIHKINFFFWPLAIFLFMWMKKLYRNLILAIISWITLFKNYSIIFIYWNA